MDKRIKQSLLIIFLVSTIGACTTSGDVVNNPNAGVTHTHNGIAHTHRLPAEGLRHAHNTPTSNVNRTCQPCGNNTNNQAANSQCHLHEGRRHCHPLPASGVQHTHNSGAGIIEPTNIPVTNPAPNNPVISYQPPTSTTIPYPTTPSNQFPTNTNTQPNPSSYYTPAPVPTNSFPSAPPPQPRPYSPNPVNNSNPPQSWGSSSCDTASGNFYIVQPKDGVYRIGVNNGVKRDDIIRLNNLQAPDFTIQPGQCLRLR